MILVASQRSGAAALADHLMNDRDNDHIEVIEQSGFMAEDLHGALQEAYAVSRATKCTQFLFSCSLNPPEGVVVTDDGFRDAAERVAEKLGLEEQPYSLIIHEKNGRRHAHLVVSRIDADTMKAINLPHFKTKLRDLSKEIFLDHGWELPEGLQTYDRKNPLNFTLAEWQQAQRTGIDPREMKQLFRAAWEQSDDLASYQAALEDKGLYLAKGDRRGFIAIDVQGNTYSVARWTGQKSKDVKARLGEASKLQSADDVRKTVRSKVNAQVLSYIKQVKDKHTEQLRPYLDERTAMVTAQRRERAILKSKQEQRWKDETHVRMGRLNKGLRGLFDRLTGSHRQTIKRNEAEALSCTQRDKEQRVTLIEAQILERMELQDRVKQEKVRQGAERKHMAKTVNEFLQRAAATQHQRRDEERRRYRGPAFDR
nr:relaxase/mobilization nuclease domain-containing protein [Hasllibacter sp. MH4015]